MRQNGACGWSGYDSIYYDCEEFEFENLMLIFPNPLDSENTLQVKNKDKNNQIHAVSIYNQFNMLVFSKQVTDSDEFNILKKLSAGIYTVIIETKKGKISKKLIIK